MRDLHELNRFRNAPGELLLLGRPGGSMDGVFTVIVGGKSFNIIATSGGGWDHVSVTPKSDKRKTCPTWEEMSAIKDLFFKPEECVIQYHPPHSDYVNLHQRCLHLWRPNDGTEIPRPP